jgi:hypothetical protein
MSYGDTQQGNISVTIVGIATAKSTTTAMLTAVKTVKHALCVCYMYYSCKCSVDRQLQLITLYTADVIVDHGTFVCIVYD